MTQNEHVYAIRCRPDEASDVISGDNVKNTEDYAFSNCDAASISSFL